MSAERQFPINCSSLFSYISASITCIRPIEREQHYDCVALMMNKSFFARKRYGGGPESLEIAIIFIKHQKPMATYVFFHIKP